MDPIKEAFSRAKEDIQSLRTQFVGLSVEINNLKSLLTDLIRQLDTRNQSIRQPNPSNTESLNEPINNDPEFWAHKALKPHSYSISTGNRGVSTDSQTDQQSDITSSNPFISTGKPDQISNSSNISNLLNSLDTIKKDLRNKFKKLTKQEMLVFSTIYQLQEEGFVVDYPLISKKLSLSESSIRDYIQRITKKNVPLVKSRENNKKVYLSIPSDIKNIASLETIIKLREI